jgi:hypothetical protein
MKDNNAAIPDNFQHVALKFAPLLMKTKMLAFPPPPPLISKVNNIETKANVSFENGEW